MRTFQPMVELDHQGPAPATTARRDLTLAALQRTFVRLERARGLVAARRFARTLDYDHLTRLARAGVAEGRAEDHPATLDPRYLLLWGARGPAVARLQYALGQIGHDCPSHGLFEDATLAAYRAWLASVAPASLRLQVR